MGKHSLDLGKRWIEGLVALGRALGYLPEPEFDVSAEGEAPAPVDVAWLRSERDKFPLFIFEVESKPSGHMTQNAAKVFSQETALFEKPLFHFHLVLSGSGESGRVKSAERLFGEFNYRVYSVADSQVAVTALRDVLSQHRRVGDRLDLLALAKCLEQGVWAELDLEPAWIHAEEIGFEALWLRDYATLSLDNRKYLIRLLRVIERELAGTQLLNLAQYDSYVGQHCATAIHAGLIAAARPELGEVAFEALREWQKGDGWMKQVAPYYGRNEQYDNFVFALMPAIWGLLAALFDGVDGTRVWILEQMEMVVGRENVHRVFAAQTAAWMLQIAAAGGAECERLFEAARERLNAEGGLPAEMLSSPSPRGGLMDELDEWEERLALDAAEVPDLADYRSQIEQDGGADDLIGLALTYLLVNELPKTCAPTLSALAAQAGGRPA
jgi:hypothetical protein